MEVCDKFCEFKPSVSKEDSNENQMHVDAVEKSTSQNSVEEIKTEEEDPLKHENVFSDKKVSNSSSKINIATVCDTETNVQSRLSKSSKKVCVKTSEISKSEDLTTDKSSSTILSPEAKEFEPTREYGKAKLQLTPEVSKEIKSQARCPKLTSFR